MPDQPPTDPQIVVDAWNAARPRGHNVLVRYWTGDNPGNARTGLTAIAAYLLNGVPTVRIWPDGGFIPLDHVRVHPLAERVAALPKVDVPELEFPPPPCRFCETVDCEHDGDGFTCPECRARWSSNGNDGRRQCVEDCGDDAEVVGEDGQPRCRACQADVLSGELEATEPHQCKRCSARVVGFTLDNPARMKRLCGGCHAADRQAAWLAGSRG